MGEHELVELSSRALPWNIGLDASEELSNTKGKTPRRPALASAFWEVGGVVIRPGKGGRFPEEALEN